MEMDVPHEMLHPQGGMSVGGHIKLINHQLKQIRSALALATALGRKLVLPPVTCGYDKAWYPLSGGRSRGAFGGAHGWILPIRNCPLDHYLEPHPLRPTETLREYSFLDNPRTPKGAVAAESLRGGAPGDRHAEVGRLKAISAPVLNVTNLATIDVLNDDYLTAEQAKAFRSKFGYAGGSWCCAPSEEKGAPRNAHFSLMRA